MFFFKTYALDEKTGTLSLSYAYQEHTFTETILFPVPFPKISNAKKKALDRVCFLTHIACGISYFKAFLPKKIKIESGNLTKEEATFFREFYLKGLGEFSYRNKVHLENLVPALFKGTSIQKEPLDIPFTPSKVLIPVGGGKDSCLSMELFKQKTNKDVTAFSVGTAQPIMDCIKTAGVPHLCIKRTIAPELIKLNQTGTVYNGHIPITGIISFITWLCAIIYDYKYIVLSCERSANTGNVAWGKLFVNHQYSKSIDFETNFRHLITVTTPQLEYFSLLRPCSELLIASLFTRYCTNYTPVITSCNKAFFQDESKRWHHWCGDCDKCRFVFLLFALYLSKDVLLSWMQGRNLLDEKEQLQGYKELFGFSNHKPFECVGEIDECCWVLDKLSKRSVWKDAYVIKTLSPLLKTISKKRFLTPYQTKHFVPKEIFMTVFKDK